MQQYLKIQRGATVVLTLVFMLGMLAMIGLAIDTGHLLVNKDRFQNAMDGAALSAAIVRNGASNNSIAEATAAGIVTFNLFKLSDGNAELANVTLKDTDFLFSDRVNKFFEGVGTGSTAVFVRVSSSALQINNFFIQVATGNPKENVTAVSTAGPVGQNCDLVPFVVCAADDDLTTPELETDKNCTDDTDGSGVNDCYGHDFQVEQKLAPACNENKDPLCNPNGLGSASYSFFRIGDSTGANDLKNSLQGTSNVCDSNPIVDLEPGKQIGPVQKGLDYRFNNDTVTSTYDDVSNPTYSAPAYKDYLTDQSTPNNSDGTLNYRLMSVPIADCTGTQHGSSDPIELIFTACALLRREVEHIGKFNNIYIELVARDDGRQGCPSLGATDPTNAVINGPFKIVLFKSEGRGDS